jgi:hypothetical protein
MAPSRVDAKLLTQAAREVLRPMGLTQRGRSRSWIDDHGWWLCLVGFPPISGIPGFSLEVAAMWLWDDKADSFHYDVHDYRVDDAPFAGFESEEQFAPEARRLVEVAARNVVRYRELFADLRSAAAYLDSREDAHDDALYSGIAWGVLGEMDKAADSFDRSHQIIERYWQDSVRALSSRSDKERARL